MYEFIRIRHIVKFTVKKLPSNFELTQLNIYLYILILIYIYKIAKNNQQLLTVIHSCEFRLKIQFD